jgi:two-component system KDP operon response regulator KdpE
MDPTPGGAPRPLVLVVEDEPPIRKFLRASLEGQGYALVEADTAARALAEAAVRAPDIVLLDLGLPDQDGLEVLRRIREWSPMPIVVLTARGRDDDKVRALDAGADDYITKPFSVPELLARMRVALRHRARLGAETTETSVTIGEFRIDFARRRVTVRGDDVVLTPIEFRLMATLARHAGRVLTHDNLLREAWGPSAMGQRHYVRVYMAQLRQKIEADPARPRILLTETGVGYRMAEPDGG